MRSERSGSGALLVAEAEQARRGAGAGEQDQAIEAEAGEQGGGETGERTRTADRGLGGRDPPGAVRLGLGGEAERGGEQLAVAEPEPIARARPARPRRRRASARSRATVSSASASRGPAPSSCPHASATKATASAPRLEPRPCWGRVHRPFPS